jgi:citrate lyase subunit beta/citryl-CoA lyase
MTLNASAVRSYLYVPGDSGERLERAASRGADAVIADLEDSVAVNRKDSAADSVIAWLTEPVDGRCERWVRVNGGPQALDDIRRVFRPGLTGICLAKADCCDRVTEAADVLDELEHRYAVPAQTTLLMPLVESARGIRSVLEIAESPRVHKLQIGELDLAAELGVSPGPDEAELTAIRSDVVVAAAAAGLLPPVGAVSPEFRDQEALAVSTERLKRAGFVGRAAIHPAQLETIHRVFSVTPDEAARARAVVHDYEQAAVSGVGVLVDQSGRMVDEAVVRMSRRVVALAAAAEERNTQ